MKKFLITAAVVVGITALAVLVLNTSMCQTPDPGPDPDTTIKRISVPAPSSAPTASAKIPNEILYTQRAESGSVTSMDGGYYSLTLHKVSPHVEKQDDSKRVAISDFLMEIFKEKGVALATLDYDNSQGPVRVKLRSPAYVAENDAMGYDMEILDGKQVLSKFENPILRVKHLWAQKADSPVP